MVQKLNRNSIFIDGNPVDKLPEIVSFDDGEVPEYISSIFLERPASVYSTLAFECDINPDKFKRITGIDLANNRDVSCSMKLISPYQIQKRKHKKRRINKKWAKKYGYKTRFEDIILEVCSVEPRTNGVDIISGNYIHM